MSYEGYYKLQANVNTDIRQLKSELLERLGHNKYDVWFSESDFRINNDCLTVLAPNAFVSGMLKKTFYADINECAKNISGTNLSISFDVFSQNDDSLPARQASQNHTRVRKVMPLSKPVVVDTQPCNSSERSARSYKHTLDTFIVGSKNKLAYNAAKAVSETPGKDYNPLFFYGTYGVGKTHLLQAICNQAIANRPNALCVYVSAEEFTNEYVNAFRTQKLDNFRKKYRNVDILAIDDIHFLANKKSTQEEFLHTFNSIDLADKQIVLASDAHPTMIAELAENLVNRFVSGMVVKIETPDYDTRLKICRQKTADMGIKINDEILEYVAANITKSVRDIEGALLKLNAHIMLTGEPLSLALAQYLLGQAVSKSAAGVRVEDVESSVATFFGTTLKDMRSAKKDQTVSLARSVAMHLLRDNTDMSFPEIGKSLGGKNHATVIMACKKIKELAEKNCNATWKVNGMTRSENINTIIRQLQETIRP